ncbi:MAG: nitronate monooxygenase family protein [Ignavibacteria bacterium]|nr:nitronate monooxygenase family protein [Ignavibacteria bacterium]
MSLKDIKELKIGDLLAKLPIIQGGMGVRISLSNLAAAVANEGGIGVIATAGIGLEEPDHGTNFLEASIRALKREIGKVRELTKGIIGVNIMGALTNYADMVNTCIEEKVDIIFTGAGLPLHLPQFLKKDSTTKLVPIVSSARAAGIISKSWTEKYNYPPDAVVVEGPKAGGHLGFKNEQINDSDYILEKIIPEVIEALKPYVEKYERLIPVIAAGGIYTGEDIHKFFQLGASGVQMGTRFVSTFECDASEKFKQTYIDATEDDIVIIKSPVGMPGRAIRNKFIDAVEDGKKQPFKCPYHCIKTCDYQTTPYCIAFALSNAYKGKLEHGFAFAGENAHRVTEIISVKELMDTLVNEYKEAQMPVNENGYNKNIL